MDLLKSLSKMGSPVASAVFMLSKYWQSNLIKPF